MFISMAYLILDHHHDGVTLARAGHDAPLCTGAVTNRYAGEVTGNGGGN